MAIGTKRILMHINTRQSGKISGGGHSLCSPDQIIGMRTCPLVPSVSAPIGLRPTASQCLTLICVFVGCSHRYTTNIIGCMWVQSSQSKLEKADILEMTVKHLRNTQRQQLSQCEFTQHSISLCCFLLFTSAKQNDDICLKNNIILLYSTKHSCSLFAQLKNPYLIICML